MPPTSQSATVGTDPHSAAGPSTPVPILDIGNLDRAIHRRLALLRSVLSEAAAPAGKAPAAPAHAERPGTAKD